MIKHGIGKTIIAAVEPKLSLISTDYISNTPSIASHGSTRSECNLWILDSGATDHMTFDAQDFCQHTVPKRTSIGNVNGTISSVQGAGTLMLSLSNTLFVSFLSHKLFSINQLTKDLNFTALMYPDFCLIQDILTKKIIGHGTKKGGLYNMDDFNMGQPHHVGRLGDSRIEQIWLWHRRLNHPSFGYLKHLLPSLFSNFSISDFQCETCILDKS